MGAIAWAAFASWTRRHPVCRGSPASVVAHVVKTKS